MKEIELFTNKNIPKNGLSPSQLKNLREILNKKLRCLATDNLNGGLQHLEINAKVAGN